MPVEHESHYQPEKRTAWWKTRSGIVCLLFLAAAGYFAFMEHRAHLVPYLPWAILLLCPLIHLFHHGGHSHGNRADTADPVRQPED